MRNAKRSEEKAIACSFAFTAAIASEKQEKYLYMVCVLHIYMCELALWPEIYDNACCAIKWWTRDDSFSIN